MLYRRRPRRRQGRRRQVFPACLTRQCWRSFLTGVPLRAAVLIAFAGLSLITLAGLGSRGGSSEGVQPATIQVGDEWFCDPGDPFCMVTDLDIGIDDVDVVTTVNVGDTVVWEWGPGGAGTKFDHTTTHCADDFISCSGPREWDSSPATTSGPFSHTFGPEDAGKTFLYRCQEHIFTMHGSITVRAAAEPGPSPTPSPELSPQPSPPSITPTPTPTGPSPAPTPSPEGSPEGSPEMSPQPPGQENGGTDDQGENGGTAEDDMPPLPGGGGAPPAHAGTSIPWWLAIAAGGFLMASASLLALRLRR